MSEADYLAVGLMNFIRHSPMLIVGLLGLWFARSRKELLGVASPWALWGFCLLIAHAAVGVIGDVASVSLRVAASVNPAMQPDSLGLALYAWGLASYIPLLLALILLARAVFLGRGLRSESHEEEFSSRRVAV